MYYLGSLWYIAIWEIASVDFCELDFNFRAIFCLPGEKWLRFGAKSLSRDKECLKITDLYTVRSGKFR